MRNLWKSKCTTQGQHAGTTRRVLNLQASSSVGWWSSGGGAGEVQLTARDKLGKTKDVGGSNLSDVPRCFSEVPNSDEATLKFWCFAFVSEAFEQDKHIPTDFLQTASVVYFGVSALRERGAQIVGLGCRKMVGKVEFMIGSTAREHVRAVPTWDG